MKANPQITEVDIKVYYLLYETVVLSPHSLEDVPTFIINETIWFFENREEYEKCDDIKTFFEENSYLMVACSRKDYMDNRWETIKRRYDNQSTSGSAI